MGTPSTHEGHTSARTSARLAPEAERGFVSGRSEPGFWVSGSRRFLSGAQSSVLVCSRSDYRLTSVPGVALFRHVAAGVRGRLACRGFGCSSCRSRCSGGCYLLRAGRRPALWFSADIYWRSQDGMLYVWDVEKSNQRDRTRRLSRVTVPIAVALVPLLRFLPDDAMTFALAAACGLMTAMSFWVTWHLLRHGAKIEAFAKAVAAADSQPVDEKPVQESRLPDQLGGGRVEAWRSGDGPGRDRTCDLGIKSPLLYQLSYRPQNPAVERKRRCSNH